MAEKKDEKIKGKTPKINTPTSQQGSYSMNEVFKITDELFTLSKEREYPFGAFVHGLIFALEFAQQTYQIPPQQLAEIKRNCRRYVEEIVRINNRKDLTEPKKKY